ncbi:Abc transporter b family member 25 [Globisporangium polare]
MVQQMTAGIRIGMRAHERAFTIADNASLKTIFVMNVSSTGAATIDAFLMHLPQALVLTFNRHPRMRAMQVKGEFAVAEIQPQISLDTVSELKLLGIRTISGSEGREVESWEEYAEVHSNLAIDRYAEFPYYVRVFRYPEQQRVRLFLCCDHYMSDGISGIVVLNDIMTFASSLSRSHQSKQVCETLARQSLELPLRKPLYELWLDSKPWTAFFGRTMLRILKNMIFTDASMQFKPVITPRADQKDLMLPIQVNSSSVLFGQGTSENMNRALQRCKDEGVTLFGAIAASVLVAFYVTCDEEKRQSSPFKLGFEVVANMRGRVPEPAPEVQVGTYMNSYALECLLKQGVDMNSTSFWDLARKTRSELDAHFEGFMSPMRLLVVDEYVTATAMEETLEVLKMPYSCSADTMVSNIGKYAHETTLAFQTGDGDNVEDLKIDQVHVCGSFPNMGTATILYVTSIDSLSYGFMHKYEDVIGAKLFKAMTVGIERIGEIGSQDGMLDVARAVQQQQCALRASR